MLSKSLLSIFYLLITGHLPVNGCYVSINWHLSQHQLQTIYFIMFII